MTDDTPVYSQAHFTPPKHHQVVREEIIVMHRAGTIKPVSSALSFTDMISTNKYGKSKVFVDYGVLNQRMRAWCWKIPNNREIFDYLFDGNDFKTLELFFCYWQITFGENARRIIPSLVVLEFFSLKSSHSGSWTPLRLFRGWWVKISTTPLLWYFIRIMFLTST